MFKNAVWQLQSSAMFERSCSMLARVRLGSAQRLINDPLSLLGTQMFSTDKLHILHFLTAVLFRVPLAAERARSRPQEKSEKESPPDLEKLAGLWCLACRE